MKPLRILTYNNYVHISPSLLLLVVKVLDQPSQQRVIVFLTAVHPSILALSIKQQEQHLSIPVSLACLAPSFPHILPGSGTIFKRAIARKVLCIQFFTKGRWLQHTNFCRGSKRQTCRKVGTQSTKSWSIEFVEFIEFIGLQAFNPRDPKNSKNPTNRDGSATEAS